MAKRRLSSTKKPTKWIQSAIKKPGSLSKTLGVPEKNNIPMTKLRKAAKGSSKTAKRARLAITLKGLSKRKKSK